MRPADQKAIRAAVDQMAKKDPAETARTAVVYNIESASPSAVSSAVSVLTTIYPNARFVAGTEPGKLVAHARPAEQAEIKRTIDQLAHKDPPETARRMVIYTLESAGPAGVAGAMAALSTVFPDAKFVPSAEPGKLAVWARLADHTEIRKAIEEMDKKEPPEKAHFRGGLQHRNDQSLRRFRSCQHLDPDVPQRADRGRKRAGQGACLARPRTRRRSRPRWSKWRKRTRSGPQERRWSTTSNRPPLPRSGGWCRS